MLTNFQLIDIANAMKFPLEKVCFKNELSKEPLKYTSLTVRIARPKKGKTMTAHTGSLSMSRRIRMVKFTPSTLTHMVHHLHKKLLTLLGDTFHIPLRIFRASLTVCVAFTVVHLGSL